MNVTCTRCGAKVPIETDTSTVRCPFCESALSVETDRTVMHHYMGPQIKIEDLNPVLQRKLSYLEIRDRAAAGWRCRKHDLRGVEFRRR